MFFGGVQFALKVQIVSFHAKKLAKFFSASYNKPAI